MFDFLLLFFFEVLLKRWLEDASVERQRVPVLLRAVRTLENVVVIVVELLLLGVLLSLALVVFLVGVANAVLDDVGPEVALEVGQRHWRLQVVVFRLGRTVNSAARMYGLPGDRCPCTR